VAQARPAQTIASRTYGQDRRKVSELGAAFIQGPQAEGVVATRQHFPGLGAASANTDNGSVTIAATRPDLEAGLAPSRPAIDAGVAMVMVSTATYPTLGSKKLAAFSPAIVNGLLRDQLGL